ncbi:MAG: hypothetical protein ACTHN5_08475 [Phycisphaerae bacterium]
MMTGFGHKIFAMMVSLVVLAAMVVCPCAVGIFSDVGHGRVVMSCCEHSEKGGGQPGKDMGDTACKAYCSTRVMDHVKSVAVDMTPTHFVGVAVVPVMTAAVGVPVVGRWDGWESGLPREAARSLLRLHCALLV